MKQFFCIVVALAASAALLFLVSAPVNNLHSAEETHGAESSSVETDSAAAHGVEPIVSDAH